MTVGTEEVRHDTVMTARRLRTLHSEPREENICWWCLKPWPCPDRRWADRVVTLWHQLRVRRAAASETRQPSS